MKITAAGSIFLDGRDTGYIVKADGLSTTVVLEFRLWLKDPLALYGVKNALLAPGYRSPDKNKGEP